MLLYCLTHWDRDKMAVILPDNVFKGIFLNGNVRISIKISLKFVPKGLIYNISALVQVMAWCSAGYRPLSEPMTVRLPKHICVTRPQWVNLVITWSNIIYIRVLNMTLLYDMTYNTIYDIIHDMIWNKNISRHTTNTIVSWPNLKQGSMVNIWYHTWPDMTANFDINQALNSLKTLHISHPWVSYEYPLWVFWRNWMVLLQDPVAASKICAMTQPFHLPDLPGACLHHVHKSAPDSARQCHQLLPFHTLLCNQ